MGGLWIVVARGQTVADSKFWRWPCQQIPIPTCSSHNVTDTPSIQMWGLCSFPLILGRSSGWPPADSQPEARPLSLMAQGNEFRRIPERAYKRVFPQLSLGEMQPSQMGMQPSQRLNAALWGPEQRTQLSHEAPQKLWDKRPKVTKCVGICWASVGHPNGETTWKGHTKIKRQPREPQLFPPSAVGVLPASTTRHVKWPPDDSNSQTLSPVRW